MDDTLLAGEVRHARDRLEALGRWYASRPRGTPLAVLERMIGADEELGQAARRARIDLLAEVDGRAGRFDPKLLAQLLEVPRERFVRPEDIGESATDTPLLLDEEGLSTISAPHAYLLSFDALALGEGDHLAELGTGSGYGAALASHVVGKAGAVLSVEIDELLARRAARLLEPYANVRVIWGDAGTLVAAWGGHPKVTVTFAVDDIPPEWLAALPEGGRMVIPVGSKDAQRLMLAERRQGRIVLCDHGAVRYVRNRASAPLAAGAAPGAQRGS